MLGTQGIIVDIRAAQPAEPEARAINASYCTLVTSHIRHPGTSTIRQPVHLLLDEGRRWSCLWLIIEEARCYSGREKRVRKRKGALDTKNTKQ